MHASQRLEHQLGDLTLAYRPQREWVEGRGLWIIVAHFFTSVGAGTWILSSLVRYLPGLVTALLLVGICGGAAHLQFLGRWERFWRMVSRPQTSWISRGFLGIVLFMGCGSLYVVSTAWPEGGVVGRGAMTGALLGAVVVICYQGFLLTAARAIPFWRSRLVPALYAAYALRGGAAFLLVAAALGSRGFDIDEVEVVKLWLVVSTAVLLLMYILTANASAAARRSVQVLLTGSVAPSFYAGVVVLGLIIPIVAGMLGTAPLTSRALLGIVGISSLIGDFYIKYCVLKAGFYLPITVPFAPESLTLD